MLIRPETNDFPEWSVGGWGHGAARAYSCTIFVHRASGNFIIRIKLSLKKINYGDRNFKTGIIEEWWESLTSHLISPTCTVPRLRSHPMANTNRHGYGGHILLKAGLATGLTSRQTAAIWPSSMQVSVTTSVKEPPAKYSMTTHSSSPTR